MVGRRVVVVGRVGRVVEGRLVVAVRLVEVVAGRQAAKRRRDCQAAALRMVLLLLLLRRRVRRLAPQ